MARLGSSLLFQAFVSPIAARCVAGMFALADINGFRVFCLKNMRTEFGVLVRAIAKSAIGRKAAGAVGVLLTGFELDLFGEAGSDLRFVHGVKFGLVVEETKNNNEIESWSW